MRRITLNRGFLIKVWGPAKVVVERGCALVSGVELCEPQDVLVGSERGVSVYALRERVELALQLGGSASFDQLKIEEEFISSWMKVVEDVKSRGFKRVVVVGPAESGKSTMTAWLLNNLKSWVIEADIGQNELGLPAMVSAAKHPGKTVATLQDLAGSSIGWFVGHVSAEQAGLGIVAAAIKACKRADSFVMDTDGFVRGAGVLHKQVLVQAVEADLAVCMGCCAASALKAYVEEVICVPEVPRVLVRERDRTDRKSFRERQYARLFADSKPVKLEQLETANLCFTSTLEEEVLRDLEGKLKTRILDAWRCEDTIVLVSSKHATRMPGVIALQKGWAKGLICSLKLSDYDVPCLVEDLRIAESRAVVRVPRRFEAEIRKTFVLALGYIRLDENLREVEKYRVDLHPLALIARHRGRPQRA